MQTTDTLVLGAGQAGLAMSRCLTALGIDHLVLERGRLAERWRNHWDSLRLLTPRWQSRLPGLRYQGADADGFMPAAELVAYLERYAHSFDAPVQTETTVLRLEACERGFRAVTDRGVFEARAVVIATGHADVPHVPALASELPRALPQLTAAGYENPAQLPAGGVLVVGASATGAQLADELQRSGRQVTLAVGRHTRLPRRHRGHDILFWLDRMGVLGERADQLPSLEAALRQPSMQLVGSPDFRDLDLGTLRARGVRLVGRALGASGGRVRFASDLGVTVAAADRKLARLLERIDAFAAVSGLAREHDPEPRAPLAPTLAAEREITALNLRAEGIGSVLWATGYVRRYPWLQLPVLDARGEIRQRGGVTPVPGLYTLGMRLQRTRKSSFLDGVGDDARELAPLIARHLGAAPRAAA